MWLLGFTIIQNFLVWVGCIWIGAADNLEALFVYDLLDLGLVVWCPGFLGFSLISGWLF